MRYDRESIKRKLKRVVKEYCDVSEERIEDYFEDLMEDFADLIFEIKMEEECNDLLLKPDNYISYDYWDVKEKRWRKHYINQGRNSYGKET